MKKTLFSLAMLLLVAVGCHRTPKTTEIDTESYTIVDSVLLENDFGEDYARYATNIDIPVTDNDLLRQNIIHWMLNDSTEDYQAFLQTEKTRFFAEEGNEPNAEFVSNYTLSEQTDQYVTYISEGYIYTGGTHPMPWYYGVSFSKSDGSMVGYDLFENPEQLRTIITTNILKQHFGAEDEDGEFFLSPGELFPLPTNEPWIETDSVVFCYGAYEIGAYSDGMPLCKIAFNDLKPYLSEKGRTLLINE